MRKTAIVTSLAMSALVFHANAQVNQRTGKEDTLKTSVATFFEYRPVISSAKKLRSEPSVIDTTVPKPEVKYIYERRQFETTFSPDTIEPAKMKGEPIDPLYRAYVRGGAGNGINYLLDGYVNTTRSRKASVGLEVHSRGTDGNLNDVAPAPYNRTNVALHGKKFLKKHSLEGTAGYDRERLQYYGFDATNPFYFNLDQDAFRQTYQDIYAEATLKSFYNDSSKVNHVLNLDYDYFSDRGAANNEHNAVLDAQLAKYIGRHQGNLGVNLDLNSVNYVDSFEYQPTGTIDASRFNLIAGINPKIITQAQKFRLEIGLLAQAEFRDNSSSVHLYPDLYAKYNLVKEVIIPYAGFNGGLQRNNLRSMTEENPFLWTPLLALRNTNELYRFYGGIRGAISNEWTFNFQGARYKQEDAPLFVNYNASQYNQGASRFGENYFVVAYDTLDIVELSGELMYRDDEKWQVAVKGVYRSFTTTNEFEAWQRPGIEIGASGFYQIRHKIIAKASAFVLADQWSKSFDPESDELFGLNVYGNRLDPILDFNIGAEYRYTEQLSLFLNVNNIIAQRYQRWNQYPNQRINVLGGLTYSFWRD